MNTDTYVQHIEDAWPEAVADSWEALDRARQAWRDEDREVVLDDDERERS